MSDKPALDPHGLSWSAPDQPAPQPDESPRDRAIDAIYAALGNSRQFVVGMAFGLPPDLPSHEVRRSIAEAVLEDTDPDALLAALGHTDCVPREVAVHEREWGNAHFADWKKERDRAERAEQRLRTIHGLAYGALPEASGEALDGGDSRG